MQSMLFSTQDVGLMTIDLPAVALRSNTSHCIQQPRHVCKTKTFWCPQFYDLRGYGAQYSPCRAPLERATNPPLFCLGG